MGRFGLDPIPPSHPCLTIVTSAVMHISRHTLENVIVGSHGPSIFSFVRTLHTVFHSGRSDLCCHQQCKVWPVPLRLVSHSLALRDAFIRHAHPSSIPGAVRVCIAGSFLRAAPMLPSAFLSGSPGYLSSWVCVHAHHLLPVTLLSPHC